jgi:hypothetical protein
MRSQPYSWTRLLAKLGFAWRKLRSGSGIGFRRTLRFEQCEDRRMLATIMVANANDAIVNTPAAIGTLRQAIFDADLTIDLDTIEFASGLSGATIDLTQGELSISQSVTIDASMLQDGITIDAGNGADSMFGTGDGTRIFNITGGSSTLVTLNGLTLTGGDVTVDGGGMTGNGGGAILSTASLDIENCTVKNNNCTSVTGSTSSIYGGGIGNSTQPNKSLSLV